MLSRATIYRILRRAELITPQPRKKPRSSYVRFQAEQPNETWQSDVTHWRLADRAEVEIITWLDDHSRYALSVTAHTRVTGPIVVATFGNTTDVYGVPFSTLTDNGLVFTIRFAQPAATTIADLQTQLDTFVDIYNHHRPTARSHTTPRPRPPTPADPKAPRHDATTTTGPPTATGKVTLRHHGHLFHIGIGRPHAGTPILLLIHDLDIRIIHAATGEIIRTLTLDPERTYQPTGAKRGGPRRPNGPRKSKQPEP